MEVAMNVLCAWAVIESRYRQGLCARRDKECAVDLALAGLDETNPIFEMAAEGRGQDVVAALATLRARFKALAQYQPAADDTP
jgi:hypothetical protein